MGYSLYITRRNDWADSVGPSIGLPEWVAYVETAADLRWEPSLGKHFAVPAGSPQSEGSWLTWERGNLESKHPDKAMISMMHVIADALSARLVGEEGEGYDRDGDEILRPRSGAAPQGNNLWQSIRACFSPPVAADPKLGVGCRVRDAIGRSATVSKVDLLAQFGLGAITVRYDDGRTASFAAMAHGLKRIDSPEGGI